MLGQPSSVPGFEVVAASVADRADPARRRPAQLRHPQRHAGRLDRSRPAPVDRRAADLARRPRRRRVGHAQGPGLPHRPVPPCPPQGSARMLNLAEYRKKTTSLADYLPWACLVGPGIVLNKDGSFQRTLRYRGPDLDSATEAELVSITRAAQQRPEALRRRLGAVLRGRARPGQPVSRRPLRRSGLVAGRSGALRRLQRRRRPPREPVLPDLPLSAAARARGPRRALPVRAHATRRPSRPSRTPSSNGS